MPSDTVRVKQRKYSSFVREVDPDRRKDLRKTVEYKFEGNGRTIVKTGDPSTRGIYAAENQ